ncbi:TrbC/VirB2 family protein [Wolbachia pipientis]|nr:TrbC/VirB2 family protein [Wolbachia pipientis]
MRFFFEIYYHENSNFPFAAGLVIIGAALLAIFGRMPWPALFALGAFTAVFFGAPVVVSKIVPGGVICKDGVTACPDGKKWNATKNTCA